MNNSTPVSTSPEPPRIEDEPKGSYIRAAAITHVLWIINAEIDCVERKTPKAQKGRQLKTIDQVAQDFFDAVWCLLQDIRDDLILDLCIQEGGEA